MQPLTADMLAFMLMCTCMRKTQIQINLPCQKLSDNNLVKSNEINGATDFERFFFCVCFKSFKGKVLSVFANEHTCTLHTLVLTKKKKSSQPKLRVLHCCCFLILLHFPITYPFSLNRTEEEKKQQKEKEVQGQKGEM